MTTQKLSDRFLLLGDSLTEWSFDNMGLGATVQHLYQRRLDVQNRGLGGYNTRWGLEVFKQWLPKAPSGSDPHTVLATLWFGANDSVLAAESQHVPLDEFRANLSAIVSLIRSPSSPYHDAETEFILITPPPVSIPDWIIEREKRGLTGDVGREQSHTGKYAQAVVDVGRELDIPVVNAFERILDAVKRELAQGSAESEEKVLASYFTDGLHLSIKGYEQIVEGVKQVIAEKYPKKHWDERPMLFPDWKTIPWESAEGSVAYLREGTQ
ncbi:hypothetical protein JCM10212_006020 [Sporobolomyces blumeae]